MASPTAQQLPIEVNPKKTPLYQVLRAIAITVAWMIGRPRVTGSENIPPSGGVLLAPVHRSNLDFIITAFLTKRKLFFMARAGLFKYGWMARGLSSVGVIPIDKESNTDRHSIALCEEVLRCGQVLVLFPEGGLRRGASVATLSDGAMFIASRAGAVVVPVGIDGTEQSLSIEQKIPRRARIRAVVGTPITPPPSTKRARSALSQKSEELRVALEQVYATARRT
jgi:1-acyl-sn-glycerol-3-phosphate acyltransferase